MNNESTGSNENATPAMRRHEPHSINTEGPVAVASLTDRTALYIAIIAMVLSALCLGLFLMQTFLMPQIIEARVEAGMAEANRTALEARSTAKVTADKLTELRDALNAKGMNLPKLDGH